MKTEAFGAFVKRLEDVIESNADARTTVLAVREQLKAALQDPVFRVDCVERVIDTLEPAYIGPRFPKIHRDAARAYSIFIFYWPPGTVNEPHRHDHWTVTGVMHNTLQFRTYRADESAAAGLIPEKQFDAAAGDVGYICTPCIHNVANVSQVRSMSVHVFSHPQTARKALDFPDYRLETAIAKPAPDRMGAPSESLRDDALSTCAQMLGEVREPRTRGLLDRIFALGGLSAGLNSVKAMSTFDPLHATKKARELASRMTGPRAFELFRISDAVLHTGDPR